MSAGSIFALGLALAAHPHPGAVTLAGPHIAAAAGPVVPVRWYAGRRGVVFGRPWGWRPGCCWGRPGWGWGWGLGAGFGWGWAAPWPLAVPYAPPPPPPAPPAPGPQSFIVYFNWDRAELTHNARQIIAQAAQAASDRPGTHIAVNGYADLSGTSGYNAALSARRAGAVAAELARDGVNREAIAVQSFGKARPAVQTPDGLREPRNRDVEIDLN